MARSCACLVLFSLAKAEHHTNSNVAKKYIVMTGVSHSASDFFCMICLLCNTKVVFHSITQFLYLRIRHHFPSNTISFEPLTHCPSLEFLSSHLIIMKSDTAAVIGLAFALTTSASPISVSNSVNGMEKRDLTNRMEFPPCLNRGPKVVTLAPGFAVDESTPTESIGET